jgi:hypothetical protein
MVRSAHSATEPVGEGTVCVMLNGLAPAFGRMCGDEFSQNLCDGRGVVVGGDLGIAGHEKCLSAEVARVTKK